MTMTTTFSLFLLALTSGISGSVIPAEKKCTEPLWTVVGKHYVPREPCEVSRNEISREAILREKYFKELSAGQENPDVKEINAILDKMISVLRFRSQKSLLDDLKCTGCEAGIQTYRLLKSAGLQKDKIISILSKLCADLNVITPKICNGILQLYGDTLMTIVDQTNSSSSQICSVLLNLKCGRNHPEFQWNVTLPNTKKPPVVKPSPQPETARRLKVLHISDTHWDTEYAVGSWAECNLPLCCRKENVLPNAKATKAGIYGGWRCDTPEKTFDSLLEHIAKQHPDIDYIIWTGDIPAHDIWDQSRAGNLDVLKKTVAKIFKAFPKTPMYPALGNHESVPSNMFPTAEGENPMDWLYSVVNEQWSRWLPKNVSNTVRLGAFYTTLVRPGLRLVSMNMNYCYKQNWWLIKDDVDPTHELQWLIKVLQEAENKKEKVHIIGHVPPGSTECVRMWQTNYYRIINRFEGTVTSQFFGHTHSDEYELFYDFEDTNRPFGVAYIGPSLTTYMYHNPSYRVYYVEGDYKNSNRFVLDHESWYLNLEKSNQRNVAEWKKLYSAKEAYNMSSLYPEDWHKVYLSIKNSDKVLQQYHKYYWNDSPKRPTCGNSCRRNRLCEIRSCVQYGEPGK